MIRKEQLRAAMARYHSRSYIRGSLTVACDGIACLLLLYAIAANPRAVVAFPLACLQGIVIGRLFVLGHDACHGALFPARLLNQAVGRLAFLFSLTPYTLWEFGHNSVHHGFSNLKSRDYVWTPFSPEEWRGLSRLRKARERLYRTPFGLGIYYGFEIWWKRLFFPGLLTMKSFRAAYFWDNLLNTVFLALEIVMVCQVAPREERTAAIGLAVVLPFVFWNYLMGFAIYCHHTHPDVRWFDNRSEWSFYEAQVCATTHTMFPWGFNWLMHNIFEHTAHHADTAIPFYELRAAQKQLEELCGSDVIRVEIFSLKGFVAQMRACQIYDYTGRCWKRFEDAG